MELLNPLMLWGMLGVSVPIAIHFWHQKKGTYYFWAATQWLSEKNLQQAKGFRFDEWWLLVLRCIGIVLLCLFLSKPLWLHTSETTGTKPIHLVEPSAWVYENYKFELEAALKKGEPCFWMTQPLTAIVQGQQPPSSSWSALQFQAVLNRLPSSNTNHLQLYFTNTAALLTLPNIYATMPYSLHYVRPNATKNRSNYIQVNQNQYITLDDSGSLVKQTQIAQGSQRVYTGNIAYFIPTQHPDEKYIHAALQALTQVYGFSFKKVNELAKAQISFDAPASTALTFVYQPTSFDRRVVALPETWQAMAFNEQLPLFIGEHIIKELHLKNLDNPLSNKQIKALFALQPYHPRPTQSKLSDVLLIALLLVIGTERWLSLQKNS